MYSLSGAPQIHPPYTSFTPASWMTFEAGSWMSCMYWSMPPSQKPEPG